MSEIDEKIEKLIDQQLDGKSPDLTSDDDQQQVNFELQLQKMIDASLARSFPTEPTKELVHRKKMEDMVSDSKSTGRRSVAGRILVLAALVLILVGLAFWLSSQNGPSDPDFVRQSMASLYEKAVDRGFKPYYVCDDPVRFAAEFKKRQGVELQLGDMPEHKRMLGISYLGGVSRASTVMLGLANDEPVLVFVDKLSNDDEEMRAQVGKQGEYHVSRTTKHGLVFYEVSGFENAQLIEYFELYQR